MQMSEINHFRRDSGVSRFNYSARFDDKSGPDVVGINITTKKPKHRYTAPAHGGGRGFPPPVGVSFHFSVPFEQTHRR
jgi:hypothetical protein